MALAGIETRISFKTCPFEIARSQLVVAKLVRRVCCVEGDPSP